ncbi:MAG TPA: ABC transporter substrate-binding protein [bacterium]|nr:ABC transporter substrate-binding protein [bacterium]
MRKALVAAILLGLAVALTAAPGGAQVEKSKITVAVGGQPLYIYLPLTLANQLGYFRDAGLNVDIVDLAGGAKALEALLGGSADVVCGFIDHTIEMQAQGKAIRMFALYDRYPGLVLAVTKTGSSRGVKSIADLRGAKIGVTAPGSSTHFFAQYLLSKNGIPVDQESYIGIGTAATAVAAARRGAVDAFVNVDPTITILTKSGDATILADTRTTVGTLRVFGGPYPAGGLYATPEFIDRNPHTVQALATGSVRALHWIKTHSAAEIAERMPPQFYQSDKQLYVTSLAANLEMFSLDGRVSLEGAQTIAKVLSQFDRTVVANASRINPSQTFTNQFVDQAHKTLGF